MSIEIFIQTGFDDDALVFWKRQYMRASAVWQESNEDLVLSWWARHGSKISIIVIIAFAYERKAFRSTKSALNEEALSTRQDALLREIPDFCNHLIGQFRRALHMASPHCFQGQFQYNRALKQEDGQQISSEPKKQNQ